MQLILVLVEGRDFRVLVLISCIIPNSCGLEVGFLLRHTRTLAGYLETAS